MGLWFQIKVVPSITPFIKYEAILAGLNDNRLVVGGGLSELHGAAVQITGSPDKV